MNVLDLVEGQELELPEKGKYILLDQWLDRLKFVLSESCVDTCCCIIITSVAFVQCESHTINEEIHLSMHLIASSILSFRYSHDR